MIWLTLAAIAVLALLVALPVGLAMRGAWRAPVPVWCPYARQKIPVRIGRVGLGEAFGMPGLRRVDECAIRQDRWLCRDACLAALPGASASRA